MLSDLGTTARGHSQDKSSRHHSHTSDNIEIWGRGAGNEQVTDLETFAPFVSLLGVVRTIVQHLSGFVFSPVFAFYHLSVCFSVFTMGSKESRYQRISKLYLSFVDRGIVLFQNFLELLSPALLRAYPSCLSSFLPSLLLSANCAVFTSRGNV